MYLNAGTLVSGVSEFLGSYNILFKRIKRCNFLRYKTTICCCLIKWNRESFLVRSTLNIWWLVWTEPGTVNKVPMQFKLQWWQKLPSCIVARLGKLRSCNIWHNTIESLCCLRDNDYYYQCKRCVYHCGRKAVIYLGFVKNT